MTHPIVTALIEAVRDCVPSMDPLDEDEAKAVLAEVLRLAREPSDKVSRAVYREVKKVIDRKSTTNDAWRAGIDALTREIEGK